MRILAKEEMSNLTSSTWPGSSIPARAFSACAVSRAVRNKVAPVAFSALAVSMPMPEVDPVMTIILLDSFPSRDSSWIIWREVGRASPAPCGLE